MQDYQNRHVFIRNQVRQVLIHNSLNNIVTCLHNEGILMRESGSQAESCIHLFLPCANAKHCTNKAPQDRLYFNIYLHSLQSKYSCKFITDSHREVRVSHGKVFLQGNAASRVWFKCWVIKNLTEVFYINFLWELRVRDRTEDSRRKSETLLLCRLGAINHLVSSQFCTGLRTWGALALAWFITFPILLGVLFQLRHYINMFFHKYLQHMLHSASDCHRDCN